MMVLPPSWIYVKEGSASRRFQPRQRHRRVCCMYDSVYGDFILWPLACWALREATNSSRHSLPSLNSFSYASISSISCWCWWLFFHLSSNSVAVRGAVCSNPGRTTRSFGLVIEVRKSGVVCRSGPGDIHVRNKRSEHGVMILWNLTLKTQLFKICACFRSLSEENLPSFIQDRDLVEKLPHGEPAFFSPIARAGSFGGEKGGLRTYTICLLWRLVQGHQGGGL